MEDGKTRLSQEEKEKINSVATKYFNRLMVGCLEAVERTYGKDNEHFAFIRQKILRLGNDQKRDFQDFLDVQATLLENQKIEMKFNQSKE